MQPPECPKSLQCAYKGRMIIASGKWTVKESGRRINGAKRESLSNFDELSSFFALQNDRGKKPSAL